MEKRHYKLTDETIKINGKTLYRIECIEDFQYAQKGDKGGFIETEKNLYNDAWVSGNALVSGNASVYGNAWVSDDAWVSGNACVYGNARVYGNAWVYDDAYVSDDAWVSGNACVCGNTWVCGDAKIESDNDHCSFSCFGSANRTTTAFRQKDNSIMIVCGCFDGSIDEFIEKVKETHADNKYAKEYMAIIEVIKIKFGL